MTSQYAVEKIVGEKVVDGKSLYQIKWVGWSSKDNTWEPYQNIPQDLIKEFYQEQVIRIKQKQKKKSMKRLKTLYQSQNIAVQIKINGHTICNSGGLMFRVQIDCKQYQLSRDEVLEKYSDLLCNYYIELAKQKGKY